MSMEIVKADARDLSMIETGSIQCTVTSPPFFGQRNYGDDPNEIGKGSLDEYLVDIAKCSREIMRVTAEDGVLFFNIGDTASGSGGAGGDYNAGGSKEGRPRYRQGKTGIAKGQLCLVPEWLSIIFQKQGWLVRSKIVWDKMIVRREPPAHVKRPLVQHELILMLTKRVKIKWHPEYYKGEKLVQAGRTVLRREIEWGDVWHFNPRISMEARGHQAPFPDELPRRCILLATDPHDRVLDPFGGSHTTARVADDLDRHGISVDLYAD